MDTQTQLVRPLRNGQITLSAALHLDQVTLESGEPRIRACDPEQLPTGSEWLRDLYRLYAPVLLLFLRAPVAHGIIPYSLGGDMVTGVIFTSDWRLDHKGQLHRLNLRRLPSNGA